MRNIAAWFVACFLILLGFTRRAKKKALNGRFILSVYFHAPNKNLFEFCINWLIKNNFNFLSQEDVWLITQKKRPFPQNAVIITVDDGWLSNEENVVAVAVKYRIPVTIFIPTDAIRDGDYWWLYIEKAKKMRLTEYSAGHLKHVSNEERRNIVAELKKNIYIGRAAMSVDQVKRISGSEYITIGSHSLSHPVLVNCDDGESYMEIKRSKEIIEGWLNKEVKYFAYPNGDYSLREMRYLSETGYALAYTTAPEYLTEEVIEKSYELPRFEVFENISEAEAICRLLGVWQSIFK